MQHQATLAARLLGAAEALREMLDLHRPPIEQALYGRIFTTVHAQLTEATSCDAWQAGRALTLEQVLAEAKAFVASEAAAVA